MNDQTGDNIDEARYGRWINLAGRQRMLSQRIGLNLLIAAQGAPPAAAPALEALEAAVGQFAEAHAALFAPRGAPSILSRPASHAARAFDEGAPPPRRFIAAFIDEVAALAAALRRGERPDDACLAGLVPGRCNDVLAAMNRITQALEQDMVAAAETRARAAAVRAARIATAARDIDGAARFSRMIALNAKIAAVRAGAVGLEFAALTEELKAIADRIQASSSCIITDVGQTAA